MIFVLLFPSSGIIWEERKKRRYKALKLKECLILEVAFQKYQSEIAIGKTPNSRVILENKMEVSLCKQWIWLFFFFLILVMIVIMNICHMPYWM